MSYRAPLAALRSLPSHRRPPPDSDPEPSSHTEPSSCLEPSSHVEPSGFPEPGELRGLRILIVEDDPDIRDLLASILVHSGAVVASADCAAAGLEAVRAFRPQLLVSDIGMPQEDGYSLMRRVRALGAEGGGEIPAIALTAFTADRDRDRAAGAGFSMHLGKPVEAMDLVCAVKALAQAAEGGAESIRQNRGRAGR